MIHFDSPILFSILEAWTNFTSRSWFASLLLHLSSLNVIFWFQTFSSGVQILADGSHPVPLSACNLSQLAAFGKLCKLSLHTLYMLFRTALSRPRLSRALQDPHPKALLFLQGTTNSAPWRKFCFLLGSLSCSDLV